MMELPVTYVWTHDSIGLGEDGPTHQPVEHLAALRAIPGLDVVRPGDANETVAAWQTVLENTDRPAGLVLTRQNVPTFPRGTDGYATPKVPAAATCCSTPRAAPRRDPDRHRLRGAAGRRRPASCSPRRASPPASSRCRAASGSTPSSTSYRDTVLPPIVKARVCVEAGIAMGWRELVGDQAAPCRSSTTAPRPTTHDLPRVRHHRRGGRAAAEESIRVADRLTTAAPTDSTRPSGGTDVRTTQGTCRRRGIHLAGRPVPRAHRDREPRRPGQEQLSRRASPRTRRSSPARSPTASATTTRCASSPRPATTSTRRSSRSPPPTSATPATCSPTLRRHRRRRRPGLHRGLPRPRPRRARRPSIGQGAVGRGRPAEPLHQDPRHHRGRPAITDVLAEGISVNVTLIFGLDRYDAVMDAYLEGLERAKANGQDLSKIHSVASFFVSRVDTEIDKRLDASAPQAGNLLGLAGIANARLAYQAYEKKFGGERFAALKADGANTQRPLWASTGVKNPDYRDTMYVTDLAVANTVNTMPEKTMQAFADHGEVDGDQVTTQYAEARQVMDDLAGPASTTTTSIEVLEQRGRRQVREVVGRAGGDGRGQLEAARSASGRTRERPRDGRPVDAAAARATSRARRHRALVEDGFAGRLSRRTPTLWGPDAEEEAAKRLSVGRAPPHLAAAGRRDLRAAQRARRGRRRPRRALRHGRLVPGAGGDLRDVRRRADRAGLQPPRPGPRARSPTGSTAPSSWSPASPAPPWRPTRSGAPTSRRSPTPASTRPTRIVIVTDPGSPLDEQSREAGYRVVQRRPRRRRPLLRADRVRPGAQRPRRRRHRAGCSTRPRRSADLRADDEANPGLRLGRRWRANRAGSTSWCSSTRARGSPASPTGPSS